MSHSYSCFWFENQQSCSHDMASAWLQFICKHSLSKSNDIYLLSDLYFVKLWSAALTNDLVTV